MPKKNTLLMNVLQSVLVGVAMAILGGVVKTYLDVHDLKNMVADQKGKIDWLYKYQFPKMGEDHDGR